MTSVLVVHPSFGSLWLDDIRRFQDADGRKWVEGQVWDTSSVGSPHLPADYRGQDMTWTVPATCIRKEEEDTDD